MSLIHLPFVVIFFSLERSVLVHFGDKFAPGPPAWIFGDATNVCVCGGGGADLVLETRYIPASRNLVTGT